MTAFAVVLVLLPVLLAGYAYVGYPALLRLVASTRPTPRPAGDPAEWPLVSITVPAYNEARAIGATLDHLLALDYPRERLEILVVSDASTDGTDEIVRSYADRGVGLLRMPERRGKTAAENAVTRAARGEIIVNTDASVRLLPHSLKPLVRAFQDPGVGVASGRDISVGEAGREANVGESGYVGYEMQVRALETRVHSIIGASGCFFGFRRDCHDPAFPEALSRDFASCLIAREQGYRAVSVDDAVCVVPRTAALDSEYRRKIRTMARGLATLWYKRALLDPLRYGAFAWMLVSHKLCRWLVYPALPLSLVGLLLLALRWPLAGWAIAAGAFVVALGVVGMRWPKGRTAPRVFAIPGFALASNLAGLQAWLKVLRGQASPTWEPTKRAA